jgi:hypothetical protein
VKKAEVTKGINEETREAVKHFQHERTSVLWLKYCKNGGSTGIERLQKEKAERLLRKRLGEI